MILRPCNLKETGRRFRFQAINVSETQISIYATTQRNITEHWIAKTRLSGNLMSHTNTRVCLCEMMKVFHSWNKQLVQMDTIWSRDTISKKVKVRSQSGLTNQSFTGLQKSLKI
jgi:hypothetical protein